MKALQSVFLFVVTTLLYPSGVCGCVVYTSLSSRVMSYEALLSPPPLLFTLRCKLKHLLSEIAFGAFSFFLI